MKNRFNLKLQRSNAPTLIILALMLLFLAPYRLQAQGGIFCGHVYDFSVTNQSISTIFPGGGSWPQGSTVFVTGTLTIDQSITLLEIDFIMNAGASITITGNQTVASAWYGSFFGCSSMWRGITVQQGATAAFHTISIHDAYLAVRYLGTASADTQVMEGCVLENNLIGIGIFGFPTQNAFVPASFSANTIQFANQDPILPPTPPQTYSGSKLFRGIWITNSVVDLAKFATSKNRIKNHRYGIWMYASKVTVANMDFSNNADDSILIDTLDGTDIYSWQSNLIVGGSGANKCSFFNAQNSGIISRNTRGLSVSGALLDFPGLYGIRCVQSVALSAIINIAKNEVRMNSHFAKSAIYVERPPSGPDVFNVQIKENIIKRDALYSVSKNRMVMIDVQGKVNATDKVLIDDNEIENNSSSEWLSGIRIVGKGDFYNITDNKKLWWTSTSNPDAGFPKTSKGIIAKDLVGFAHIIQGNELLGKMGVNQSFLQAGIYLENSPVSMLVCENIIDKAYNNIECRSALTGILLKSNEMKQAFRGLYCNATANMGDQIRYENTWTGAYTIIGAKHESPDPNFQFKYDPNGVVVNVAPPTWAPLNWFKDQAGQRDGFCGGDAPDPFSPKERELLNGTLLPDATVTNWDLRHELLYKLLRRPELTTADPSAASYLNSNAISTSSPWRFAYSEHLFDNAFTVSSGQQAQTVSATAQCRNLMAQMSALDEQMAQMPGGYDLTLSQQRAQKFLDLAAVGDNLEQQRTMATPTIVQSLQNALIYAQSLPESTVYEDNLKDIIMIAIHHAQGDSLIETDFAILRAIAAQCPTTGGRSVRRAPQWLMHEEYLEYADKDWDNCGQARPEGRSNFAAVPSDIKVFPNPANDNVQITFPEKTGNWTISNMLGRIIRQGTTGEQSILLPTENWQSGIYFLTWRAAEGLTTTVKFIVSH